VTDRIRGVIAQESSNSGKRQWIAPEIEIAPARGASATFGPPGGVDYGFYS
jgi:hypothetical protein